MTTTSCGVAAAPGNRRNRSTLPQLAAAVDSSTTMIYFGPPRRLPRSCYLVVDSARRRTSTRQRFGPRCDLWHWHAGRD